MTKHLSPLFSPIAKPQETSVSTVRNPIGRTKFKSKWNRVLSIQSSSKDSSSHVLLMPLWYTLPYLPLLMASAPEGLPSEQAPRPQPSAAREVF